MKGPAQREMGKAWLKLIFRTGGQSEAFLASFEMQRNMFLEGGRGPQVKFEAGPGMGFFGGQVWGENEFNDLLAVLCKPALVFPSFSHAPKPSSTMESVFPYLHQTFICLQNKRCEVFS